jgi:hypothetical protein
MFRFGHMRALKQLADSGNTEKDLTENQWE